MTAQSHPEPRSLPLWHRLSVELVLTVHGVGAGGWWWLTPGGFPLEHSRFWLNRICPFAVLGVAVFGIVALARKRHLVLKIALLILAAMWSGAAISSRIVFPVSASAWWWIGVLIGGTGYGLAIRWRIVDSRTWVATSSVAGLLAGAFVVWALCGPEPSTHPIGSTALPSAVSENSKAAVTIRLNESVRVESDVGLISAQIEAYRLQIEPLMSFHLISPDRFWSILIPPKFTEFPPRRIAAVRHESGASKAVQIEYDRRESLLVSSADSQITEITAARTLTEATYSHLNSFCSLSLSGHRQLFLRFSPCQKVRIEVLPADYPTGRPARFAYRTADRFVVVEATSGEKGPFHELASGPLQPSESITLYLDDEDRQFASITFEDWAAQASTDLSPTAGWGVPQNAIEFERYGDQPSGMVAISLTLAATAVGRGWDTVGHSAGTYRNRMQVRFEGSSKLSVRD